MDTVDRSARPTGAVVEVGLGVVFASGSAFTTFMIADSWGAAYWALDLAVSLVVGALALLRGRGRAWTAVARPATTTPATAVSLAADLPQDCL
ncbi:hypothetical protein ACSNOI_39990, partial [Actinomadura kijaniata]